MRLVSASADKTAIVWDLTTGKPIHTLIGHTDNVRCAAFNPNGYWIASGSWDGTLRVWSADSGQPLGTYQTGTGWITRLAFSPDGRWVVVGGSAGRAEVWDYGSGRLVQRFGQAPRAGPRRCVQPGRPARRHVEQRCRRRRRQDLGNPLGPGSPLVQGPLRPDRKGDVQPRRSTCLWQPRDGTGLSPSGMSEPVETSSASEGTATASGGSISAPAATPSSPRARTERYCSGRRAIRETPLAPTEARDGRKLVVSPLVLLSRFDFLHCDTKPSAFWVCSPGGATVSSPG